MGQFERTLILVDEGASVNYGCTAPVYTKDSLHVAIVEIAKGGTQISTVQNWANVINNRHMYEDPHGNG